MGAVESSKSAVQRSAAELRAFTVIFLVGGPVISTRRSAKPGDGAATCQPASVRTARALRSDDRRFSDLVGTPA